MIIDKDSVVAVSLGDGKYLSINKKNHLCLHQTFDLNGKPQDVHINLGLTKQAIDSLQDALNQLKVHT